MFRPEETVDLAAAELETETLFRYWEVIVNNAYQISVPYIARNVKIESPTGMEEHPPVQERDLDMRQLVIDMIDLVGPQLVELEVVRSYAPLGIRFRDTAGAAIVADGLRSAPDAAGPRDPWRWQA